MSTSEKVVSMWERDERHEDLVQTLCRYKKLEGLDQPRRDDGSVKELTAIHVRCASDGSGRGVNRFPVRPDTDGADLADEIWHWCHNHGKNYELAGVDPTYVLEFHFDREKVPHGEFTLQFRYQKSNALGVPMLDLRDRRNQEAVIVQGLIQADVRRQELQVGAFGELSRGWQALGRAMHDYNQQIVNDAQGLRSENRQLIGEHRAVMMMGVDLEIKRDTHKMNNGLKKEFITQAIPAINLLSGQVYKALGNAMGVESRPFDERMMKIARKLYNDPNLRAEYLSKCDESEKAELGLALQEFERQLDKEKIEARTAAAANGVTRVMPTGMLLDLTEAQKKKKEAEAEAKKKAEAEAEAKAGGEAR